MRPEPLFRRPAVLALPLLAFAFFLGVPARASEPAASHADVVATSTSTTTSSSEPYIGASFVYCDYSIILHDSGNYGSLGLSAIWNQHDECQLPESGPLAASTLSPQDYYDPYRLTGLPEHLLAGTRLLECQGTTLVSKSDDPYNFDWTRVWIADLSATDRDGMPIDPPRVCITAIDCNGDSSDEPWGFTYDPLSDCGDVNFDYRITSADALVVLKSAVGSSDWCDGPSPVCDPDASGSVTAADALRILRVAVGSPTEMRCPIATCTP